MGTRQDRAAYCRPRASRARPRPDDRPRCPGCGRTLEWAGPTTAPATELAGRCTNSICGERVACRRRDGRWRITQRTPAAQVTWIGRPGGSPSSTTS
jgi:hypothetical protein